MTLSITIEKAKGYTQGGGRYSKKSWVARITDITATDLEREFLDADSVDWGDSQLYRKSKGVWTETYELTPGIYEICEFGDRTYKLVFQRSDGKMGSRTTNFEELRSILDTISADSLVETLTRLVDEAFAATGSSKGVTLAQAAEAAQQ